MPNGATSARSDSIQPSTPNLAAAYAVTWSKPAPSPADEEIVMMCPERCLRITGKAARVTFIGPISVVASCLSIWSGVSSSKYPG
jgi:hypothetical protein